MNAEVIGYLDPQPEGPFGKPTAGCRWVSVQIVLSNPGSIAASSVDLYRIVRLVLKDGSALANTGTGPVGRNGLDLSDLLGGDTRRGIWTFQLGPLDQADHLAVANDADGPSVAWTVDLTNVSEEQSKITATHDYRPKSSPPMGTLQQVTRLDGESLDVTPTQIRKLRASLPDYTSVCVELHISVTGTDQWPINPQDLLDLIDDAGNSWHATFDPPKDVQLFNPFRNKPGDDQTGSVCFDLPPGTVPVALQLASYPGQIYAWQI
jgi:hypothetical protein